MNRAKEILLEESKSDPNFGLLSGTITVIERAMEKYAKEKREQLKVSVAKYHAIGLAGLHQHNGVPLTIFELNNYYELALKDITEENSIEKSEAEFDRIMKKNPEYDN